MLEASGSVTSVERRSMRSEDWGNMRSQEEKLGKLS